MYDLNLFVANEDDPALPPDSKTSLTLLKAQLKTSWDKFITEVLKTDLGEGKRGDFYKDKPSNRVILGRFVKQQFETWPRT